MGTRRGPGRIRVSFPCVLFTSSSLVRLPGWGSDFGESPPAPDWCHWAPRREGVPEGPLRRPAPGPRAHTAAAPDSQPQKEVGRTLSPAPSGDEDSGETRGSCVIFLRLVKTSRREHPEGDSQITSEHLRSSKSGSQGPDKLQPRPRRERGRTGRLTGARPLARVCSCRRCAAFWLLSARAAGEGPAPAGPYAEAHRWVSAAPRSGWRAQPGLPKIKCAPEFPGGCYDAGSESAGGGEGGEEV